MSTNDDLISSTLYSLLNTLTHGAGTTIAGIGPMTMRSGPHTHHHRGSDGDAGIKMASPSGKKTEEQRALVGVTAVQVVSRLSLEIGRDDVSLRVINLIAKVTSIDAHP